MQRDVHVVGLCGSLRDGSGTRIALRRALSSAADAGARTTLVDLRSYDLPPFDPDDSDAGDAEALRSVVADADAVVLGTPMYHGSFAAPLKNALDYCGSDEFAGTTVGLLSVAGGAFPRQALGHLRTVCRSLHAWTLPNQVAVPNASSTVADGRLAEPDVAHRVERLGEELVRYAGVADYPDVATATASAAGDSRGNP